LRFGLIAELKDVSQSRVLRLWEHSVISEALLDRAKKASFGELQSVARPVTLPADKKQGFRTMDIA
jgi:hypothetical protein